MKLKMTPNTVSNFLFAQLCRTTVGEGGVLIHKFGEVLMGSWKRNICIKELYLDQLHREFLLIFNNKSLLSNQISQFYTKHFLE